MANAIRTISVARGHDVTRYALACFGGAGGQHACRSPMRWGSSGSWSIRWRACCPPMAWVWPTGERCARRAGSRPLGERLTALLERAGGRGARGAGRAGHQRCRDRVEPRPAAAGRQRHDARTAARPRADAARRASPRASPPLRLRATTPTGHRYPIVEAISAEPSAAPAATVVQAASSGEVLPGASRRHHRCIGGPRPRRRGSQARPDRRSASTTVVEPGWQRDASADGNLILDPRRCRAHAPPRSAPRSIRCGWRSSTACSWPSPRRWAPRCSRPPRRSTSANGSISPARCSTREGALIANAPHIPVHLGSMGESIRTITRQAREARDGRGIRRGDAYVLNAPYRGGTHLPDITVIMPVFYDGERRARLLRRGARASCRRRRDRAGSMPPDSRTIADEGVLFDNMLLVDEGRLLRGRVRALLGARALAGAQPRPQYRRSDARSSPPARAAPRRWPRPRATTARTVVAAYMGHVQANAEEAVRALIGRLDDGEFAYAMDNGAQVALRFVDRRAGRAAMFDFAGTSAQLPDNFNAPRSIVRAAALYVVRTLIDEAIPMNDGCLRPVDAASCPKARCSRPHPRRGRRRAMSRPARSSPTRCSARPARWRRARGR